jgi:hypothetical protein
MGKNIDANFIFALGAQNEQLGQGREEEMGWGRNKKGLDQTRSLK